MDTKEKKLVEEALRLKNERKKIRNREVEIACELYELEKRKFCHNFRCS